MRTLRSLALLAALLYSQGTRSQAAYPKGYFRNPMDIPIDLAGNFGEFRPNHFHTGLDIKTSQKEDLPVYAAAEGFISRVSVSHSGYGNCLYLQHPNGYTTVYAHLNSFDEKIQQAVLQQQLLARQWNVDFEPDSATLYYSKGQRIAYSGNTGGSVAPHLHFEIRNTASRHVINALHFQFDIRDATPPVIRKAAVYNAAASIYLQSPSLLTAVKAPGNQYIIPQTVITTDPVIKLGLIADDYMDNSTNNLGVYKTEMYVDGQLLYRTQMDELDFAENRCINGYTDYKYKAEQQAWIQLLSRSYNNGLSFYKVLERNGEIDLSDGRVKSIRIVVSDFNGNTSELRFGVQCMQPSGAPAVSRARKVTDAFDYRDRHYVFKTDAYAFYDDVLLDIRKQPGSSPWSCLLQLHHNRIPLASAQELYIRLLRPVPFELRKKLVLIHEVKAQALPGAQPQTGLKASFVNGYAFARIRTMGHYFVTIDTVAPRIIAAVPSEWKPNTTVRVTVQEESTGIRSFKAFLGDQFLVFSRKGNTFSYQVPAGLPKGRHTLRITTEDENENRREQAFQVVVH